MIEFTPSDFATRAVGRYRSGITSYSSFVLDLESAVSAVEEVGDERAGELRRAWGQLEIINALSLDEGNEVAKPDRDVDGLILEFLGIVSESDGSR